MTGAQAPYFFHHGGRAPDDAPMRDSTRHLCAAAYLDPEFRDRVIDEFVTSDSRAVAPGFAGEHDLEKVVLHCLRARRLVLLRDIVVVVCGFLALLLLPLPTMIVTSTFVSVGVALWIWRVARPRYRLALLIFWWMTGASLLGFLSIWGAVLSPEQTAAEAAYDPYTGTSAPSWREEHFTFQLENIPVLILLVSLLFVTLVYGHAVLVFWNLRTRLFPGSNAPAPGSTSPRVRQTTARGAGAQNGNLTLYSGGNPFIGAGDIRSPWARSWGITLDLTRPAAEGKTPGKVDPLDLHAEVWQRINAMKEREGPASLPPNERVNGLHTRMHVIARGECLQYRRPVEPGSQDVYVGHPLIDPHSGAPFSAASQAAVDAIIRHPQSFIRCYQRMTVNSRGQVVVGPRDGLIAPADADDVALSAFLYIAVEGHMLHAQFVAVPMTPIRAEFKIVDYLPSIGTPSLLWQAWRRTWRNVPAVLYFAPFRIVRTLWKMGVTAVAASGEQAHIRVKHDYGARISVRELAAEPAFDTFMQNLDTAKYTRMLEHRINDAMLDHLGKECGIDVSAYRAQTGVLQNHGVIITGGTVSGQIATGTGSVQHQTPPPTP